MKICTVLVALNLIIPSFAVSAEPPLPEGQRLRTIVAENYPDGNVYIGGTTGWSKRPMGPGVIIDREFNYVTPENDFKQSVVHPEPTVWNWGPADAWVKHCAETKQVIRIHGPISPQCSQWAKEDNRTAQELKQNLIEFMTALCQRYDKFEHVKWMDVVNETTHRKDWFGPQEGTDSWENPWPKIGYDESDPLRPPLYIKLAFQVATEHAPNTKLIINQHTAPGSTGMKMVQALVPYLRNQGLRVDGIGWQAHIDTGWEKNAANMSSLHELIDWAHTNDLSFHVTEMNAWLRGENKDYKAQADTFEAIVSALLAHRENGEITWNVWNITDDLVWIHDKDKEGTLFDAAGKAKPAYYAIQKVLKSPPPLMKSQSSREKSPADGSLKAAPEE
jgi:GH35 family endo-1,4-beta-xylanase